MIFLPHGENSELMLMYGTGLISIFCGWTFFGNSIDLRNPDFAACSIPVVFLVHTSDNILLACKGDKIPEPPGPRARPHPTWDTVVLALTYCSASEFLLCFWNPVSSLSFCQVCVCVCVNIYNYFVQCFSVVVAGGELFCITSAHWITRDYFLHTFEI